MLYTFFICLFISIIVIFIIEYRDKYNFEENICGNNTICKKITSNSYNLLSSVNLDEFNDEHYINYTSFDIFENIYILLFCLFIILLLF